MKKHKTLSAVILLLSVGLMVSACQFKRAAPKLEWDPSPEAQLIVVSDPIQFPGIKPTYQDESMENYIPEGILFGDGRILWVKYVYKDGITSRFMKQGFLSSEQIQALLQQFADSGFFSWKDQYSGSFIEDGPPAKSITVFLRDYSKSVVVSNAPPPQGFDELFSTIRSGAGVEGQDYRPDRAFLRAYRQFDQWGIDQASQIDSWPAESFGFSLADLESETGIAKGRYVDEEALAFAWQVINANPQRPLVEEEGVWYLLTLQITGLSNYNAPNP